MPSGIEVRAQDTFAQPVGSAKQQKWQDTTNKTRNRDTAPSGVVVRSLMIHFDFVLISV